MRKWMKRTGIGLGSLLIVLLLSAAVIYTASELRLRRQVEGASTLSPYKAPGAPDLQRGQHFATAIGKCVDCHGPDLGGKVFIEAGPLGTLIATNLTRGRGGVLNGYTDAQLERAIRRGIRADGRPLVFMPSDEFYYLSDRDVADIIAYVRSMPAVDRELPATRVGPLGRALYLAGKFPLLPSENIDQTAARPAPPAPGVTVEYGKYLATVGGCTGCHGPDLAGQASLAPGTPPPANLTPTGLGSWSEQDFTTALRTGRRPNGTAINAFMPWQLAGKMTDDEIRAVWMYLRSVPPKPTVAE